MDPVRVLLLEDSTSDARLAERALARSALGPFEITHVRRLDEALPHVRGDDLDVALVDLGLPDAEGVEVLEAIRAADPGLPVVVMTGTFDEGVALDVIGIGAQDFVIKGSVEPEVLGRSLRYALERQRLVTELRRLAAARRRFVADAAHELRAPIAVLTGTAELLARKRKAMSEEQLDRSFEMLERQALRAQALATDLLDLSRAESGNVDVHVAPVALRGEVERALEAAPPPEGTSVDTHVPPGTAAMADSGHLEQVLVNLLNNAYRYGGRHIRVEGQRIGDRVCLSVEDDGPGVPDDLVPRLFEPFARGASASVAGAGLGLAIAHRLTEAMGGDLHYEAPSQRGARFVVALTAVA